MKAKASPDAPLPKRVDGPSQEAPWLEELQDELRARHETPLIYLLVDVDGARDIAHGLVPRYVKRQAKSALVWNLAD